MIAWEIMLKLAKALELTEWLLEFISLVMTISYQDLLFKQNLCLLFVARFPFLPPCFLIF